MSPAAIEALGKAIKAGGNDLKATAVAGKNGAAVVEELLASKFLSQSGAGKKVLYSVTDEGKAEWEKQSRLREAEQQKKALLALLELVQKSAGKALTAPQVKKFPDAIEAARQRGLIEPADKANAYRLLDAGEAELLATRPLEEQLEALRKSQAEQLKQWRAAQARVSQELAAADGETDLAQLGQEAFAALDAAIAELSGFARVAALATRFRDRVAEAVRQHAQGAERLAAAREQAGALGERIEAFERRQEERLGALQEKLAARPAVPDAPAPAAKVEAAGPAEAEVWSVAKAACHQLDQERGTVKIPELTDRIRAAVEGVSVSAVHQFLQKWQGDDLLTLQVCNDRHLEPRVSEGIESPRGLLFYVQVRR